MLFAMLLFFESRIWSRRTTRAEKSAEQNGVIEYKRDTIGLGRKKLKFRQLQRKDLILRVLHRNIFTMPFLLPKPQVVGSNPIEGIFARLTLVASTS